MPEEDENNFANNLKKLTPPYVILIFTIVETAVGVGAGKMPSLEPFTAWIIFGITNIVMILISIYFIYYVELRRRYVLRHIRLAVYFSYIYSSVYVVNGMFRLFEQDTWWRARFVSQDVDPHDLEELFGFI